MLILIIGEKRQRLPPIRLGAGAVVGLYRVVLGYIEWSIAS